MNGQPVDREINPTAVIQDFQNILGNLLGSNVRDNRTGRSGQDNIHQNPAFLPFGHIALGGNNGNGGPPMAGRFTFTAVANRPNQDPDNDLFGYVAPFISHLQTLHQI